MISICPVVVICGTMVRYDLIAATY